MPVSPELTGGAGFTFEDAVAAYYMAALLAERSAPGTGSGATVRIALQRGAVGEPLDDIVVTSEGPDGGGVLGLQVKRAFAFSARASNSDFFEVVKRGWATLDDPARDLSRVRIGVAADEIDDDQYRQVRTVCEWARLSPDAADFMRRLGVPGFASAEKRKAVAALREGLKAALQRDPADEEVFRFFRGFNLFRLNLLGEAATDEQLALDRIFAALRDPPPAAAGEVWSKLRTIARDASGAAGGLDRQTLLERLGDDARFAPVPSLRPDLDRLAEESRQALASIERSIDGLVVPRPDLLSAIVRGLSEFRVVQISGLPGVGKSALLRAFGEASGSGSPLLTLKAERLAEGGWAGYAGRLQLKTPDPRVLLREMAAAGDPLLLIDGLDRIERPHRVLIAALVAAILDDPALSRWRIVVSLRDGGWEYVGRWLAPLRQASTVRVDVGSLNDAEAEQVAAAHPRLRPLLFGEPAVREIARRPFFLNVLASAVDLERNAPSSETELLTAWWNGGGYDAEGALRGRRQEGLIQLARTTAAALGRDGRVRGLDHEALESLKADRVLQDAEPGHTVSFRHDIYFEWAFVHDLIDASADWPDRLVQAGEPPALGRAVELLSQLRFDRDQDWAGELDRLEASERRTQWRRSWLVAPPSSPRFGEHHETFTSAILGDATGERLHRLLLGFQTVRTEPADRLFELPGVAGMPEARRMQIAELLAAPVELAAWRRLLSWIIGVGDRLPSSAWSVVAGVMEVWQGVAARHPNRISEGLLALAEAWLHQLEDHRYAASRESRFERFPGVGYQEEERLRRRLRELLFGAIHGFPDIADRYLGRVMSMDGIGREAWPAILTYAPLFVWARAGLLIDALLQAMCGELPRERLERLRREDEEQLRLAEASPPDSMERELLRPSGLRADINRWDWDQLALERASDLFYPPTPDTEPFRSLFSHAPREALRLVKGLANHAVAAWRELHQLDRQHGATPLPLTLVFPWGEETYWGAEREYFAYRAAFAPPILAAGLMAMEDWAFSRLEAGEERDDIIRDVVSDCSHNAVLGIAATLALTELRASEVVLPIAASQRLWRWDLQRMVRIDQGAAANEIGALGRPEYVRPLRRANSRPARERWIRQLAPLFALCSDEALQSRFSDALREFRTDPALDFEEEGEDAALLADRLRTAERWAGLGGPDGFVAEQTPDGFLIREAPFVPADTGEAEDVASHQETLRWIALANQVRIDDRNPNAAVVISAALLAEGRSLDEPDLFSRPPNTGDLEVLRQSGVAGVAARVLMGDETDPERIGWAADVILRAVGARLPDDGLTVEESILGDHPLLHAPRGLAGMIRRGLRVDEARPALLELSGCFVLQVAEAALRESLRIAEADSDLAAAALQLVTDLSIRSDSPGLRWRNESAARAARDADVQTAWARAVAVATGEAALQLPTVPRPDPEVDAAAQDDDQAEWNAERYFEPHRLAVHLPALHPVPAGALGLAVQALADDLLGWTIARTRAAARRSDRTGLRLSRWRDSLMTWLAHLATGEEQAAVLSRFVNPLTAEEDEAFVALAGPFVGQYVATRIHDAADLSADTIDILLILARRAGEAELGRRGHDALEALLRDLVALPMTRAGGAARFANGDWRDYDRMLPIVDILFERFSGSSEFAALWLELVEKVGLHYPVDLFARQLRVVIDAAEDAVFDGGGSSRMAGLIQTFAEGGGPLARPTRDHFLRVLDRLVDAGSRRAAALQRSELFRGHPREQPAPGPAPRPLLSESRAASPAP